MKIKRFVAKDMRTAIRMVQDEQGPDSVILSNRRVGDNIEVVAATDYDESLVHQAMRTDSALGGLERPMSSPATRHQASPEQPLSAPPGAARDAPGGAARDKRQILWAQDPHMQKLEQEIGDLRSMLEGRLGQVENLAWEARAPQRNQAALALERIGVDVSVARAVVEKLPEAKLPVDPSGLALRMLTRRVPFLPEEAFAGHSVVALVGPTGVGKTTTIAKLAARFAMQHGTGGLSLISTDSFRIGAQEQLRTFGRLLGVPVLTAASVHELRGLVAERSNKGLVLIDTAGVGPRDGHLQQQFDALQALPDVATLLCLAANAHCDDLLAMVSRFASCAPRACVLTKIDETRRIGASFSAAMRSQLPIAYYTDGQNVPADLHVALREPLTTLAAEQLSALRQPSVHPELVRACA